MAPQRQAEVQDALSEVLHDRCHVRFVLAQDYIPRQPAVQSTPPPAPSAGTQKDQGFEEKIKGWAEEHGGQVTIIEE
jgi:hypothetical protein